MKSENRKFINDQVIDHICYDNCLLDATISKIEIYERLFNKVISFEIQMRDTSAYKIIKIEFDDVREYSFCSSIEHSDYITTYKFMKLNNNLYYISLDPFSELQEYHEKDQDMVIAGSVNMEILIAKT